MIPSLRVSAETLPQFDTACETPGIDTVYIDAGFFEVPGYREMVKKAHKGKGGIGKKICLRFPQIWREKAEDFFSGNLEAIKDAGFDGYLCRSMEGVLWLSENIPEAPEVTFDHTVYGFNSFTDAELAELSGLTAFRKTWSEEMNKGELRNCMDPAHPGELVVYGRVPLMVSAQCIRRTSLRCDRRQGVMYLKDRTGAVMPVKNTCRFCMNTIYNSVPTVLYDLKEEIARLAPDAVRYEFTVETPEEMKKVLRGEVPGKFTRGHFTRGVE